MLASWLSRLSSAGLRRGVGGSKLWLIIGMTAVGIRALRRIAADDSDAVLYRTAIKAGDVFEIVTRPPQ